jgi:transposase
MKMGENLGVVKRSAGLGTGVSSETKLAGSAGGNPQVVIAAVMERCAGFDVGKKFITVCVMTGPADGEARSETRSLGTTDAELEQARTWITAEGCTDVIMESTGSYWKPVFNFLEGHVRVALANPHQVKARQGHKTDPKDAW